MRYQKTHTSTIKQTKFPITHAYVCTMHKVQDLTLKKSVLHLILINKNIKEIEDGQRVCTLKKVKLVSDRKSKEKENLENQLKYYPYRVVVWEIGTCV